MNFKRIGRMAICLLLVCVLLFNIVSIEARATGIVETIIAGVSTVNVPVAIAIGATLIALGVCAGSDSASFNNVVSSAESWLGTQVGYVQDGFVKMVRVVDESGEATYYAACDLFESLRGWLFDSGTITDANAKFITSGTYLHAGNSVSISSTGPVFLFYGYNTYNGTVGCHAVSQSPIEVSGISAGTTVFSTTTSTTASGYYWSTFASGALSASDYTYPVISFSSTRTGGYKMYEDIAKSLSFSPSTSSDLQLGQISTVPIDGTSAKAWANEYASKGFYVLQGGGSGQDPDDGAEGNNNWKWMLPLSLVTLLDLYAMSQADQWTGKTPAEFDEYTTSEEFDVTTQPDIDGYPAIEITPVVDPAPDTGGDSVTDPDGDSAELTWWQRFTKWFQELRTSINELPNRFDEHFENVNNNIEEVPSKFEAWINGVQTSVDAVAESILGTADEINAAIQGLPDTFLSHASMIMEAIGAVPQAILSGLQSALESLFVPDPDFIPNKVAALQAQYSFLEPMQQTGEDLKLFFQNIGSQPPIIWIDLGAGTGWYPMGGKVKFIDLTWYSQYKPTADFIVGGSIWLWLAWRMFKAIPGIISGDSGSVGAPVVAPDISFNTARLPAGRSRRKKDGE